MNELFQGYKNIIDVFSAGQNTSKTVDTKWLYRKPRSGKTKRKRKHWEHRIWVQCHGDEGVQDKNGRRRREIPFVIEEAKSASQPISVATVALFLPCPGKNAIARRCLRRLKGDCMSSVWDNSLHKSKKNSVMEEGNISSARYSRARSLSHKSWHPHRS